MVMLALGVWLTGANPDPEVRSCGRVQTAFLLSFPLQEIEYQ